MKKVKSIKDDVLEKELDIYRKYYEVDEENKTITFVLRYSSVSDLIEEDISTPSKPQIKRQILARMAELIRNIPESYHADIVLEIKDYGQYKSEDLMESMRDSVEFSRIASEKKLRRNWLTASVFTLIGILILILSIFLNVYDWYNTDNGAILKEVLDIAAWVFIWEAVTILFITPNEERNIERTLRLRLRNIYFRRSSGTENLCEEEGSYLLNVSPVKRDSIREKGRYLLLISGFLLIITGALSIFFMTASISNILAGNATPEVNEALNNLSEEGLVWLMVLIYTVSVLLMAWRIIGGIAGVSRYLRKGNKLEKIVAPYAMTMLVYHMVAFIILSFSGNNAMIGSWLSSTFGLLLNLTYIAGYFMDRLN